MKQIDYLSWENMTQTALDVPLHWYVSDMVHIVNSIRFRIRMVYPSEQMPFIVVNLNFVKTLYAVYYILYLFSKRCNLSLNTINIIGYLLCFIFSLQLVKFIKKREWKFWLSNNMVFFYQLYYLVLVLIWCTGSYVMCMRLKEAKKS